MFSDPRIVIERLCSERGEDFASLSRMLGHAEPGEANTLVAVPRSAVRASAGYGAFAQESAGHAYFGFDERWLRSLTGSRSDQLSIVRVEGDSMAPTLNAGDDILVDGGDGAARLRDGIYVIRAEDVLVVKRVALHPVGRTVTLQSDNPAYPDWPNCDLDSIHFLGRVIWAGRKIV